MSDTVSDCTESEALPCVAVTGFAPASRQPHLDPLLPLAVRLPRVVAALLAVAFDIPLDRRRRLLARSRQGAPQ